MLSQSGDASAPSLPRGTSNGLDVPRFTPLKSVVTGLGAGFTWALSRALTFPPDTFNTRSQVSRLRAEDRATLPDVRDVMYVCVCLLNCTKPPNPAP